MLINVKLFSLIGFDVFSVAHNLIAHFKDALQFKKCSYRFRSSVIENVTTETLSEKLIRNAVQKIQMKKSFSRLFYTKRVETIST